MPALRRRSWTARTWLGVVATGVVAGVLVAPPASAVTGPDPEPSAAVLASQARGGGGTAVGTPEASRALSGASGTVAVMLELTTPPASTAYSRAQRFGEAAAERAEASQVASVTRLANSVVSQLGRPATRASVLYRSARVYAGVAVTTDAARLPALAAIPGVKAVHRLVPKERANWVSVPLIGSPEAWTDGGVGRPNGTGSGVKLGIIDTGIDYTHANFGGAGTVQAYTDAYDAKTAGDRPPVGSFPSVKVAGGYDFAGNNYDAGAVYGSPTPTPDANPLDCGGHGSHVAGSAAGLGVTAAGATYAGPYDPTTDFNALRIGPGVAPQATLYALKVFGCEGSTNLVLPALEWAAVNDLDVVNMSLGSDYGSPDDPDSVASNNAVDLGIQVVASIGNNEDLYETGGSPGNARKVIATAASMDNTEIADGIAVTDPQGPTTTNYAASRSVAYSWAGQPGVTDAEVVRVGDWGASPSAGNNTDGCNAYAAGSLAGKVVLQWWDDSASRRCGSATRSANARVAGATGAVLASQLAFTTGITGDGLIPVMITTKTGSDALTTILDGGRTPTVTMTNALRNSQVITISGADDPTDIPASFTSRGLAGEVKPDVSAPGETIFSTAVGTGAEGISMGGTSMASPHVAGLASVVRQAHPTWTPEEVKAAIMNTADQDLYTGPQHTGARFDPMRVGAGRVDAAAAVQTDAVAFVVENPGAVSVSFGVVEAVTNQQSSKTVRVVDKRASGADRDYAVGVDMLNSLAGATYTVTPSTLTLGPGESGDVTVTLNVNARNSLVHKADPTIDADGYRDHLTPFSGRLLVTPQGGSALRVPLFAAPRQAGTVTAGTGVTAGGAGALKTATLTLSGTDVNNTAGPQTEDVVSRVTGLELGGTSPALPSCGGPVVSDCIEFPDVRAADLRYVGFTSEARKVGSDPFAPGSPAYAHFGVASWGTWRTAADVAEFDVWLDFDGNGQPEGVVYNTRLTGTDIFASVLVDLRPSPDVVVGWLPINSVYGSLETAKMHTNAMVLPVMLADLGSAFGLTAADADLSYWVTTWSGTAYREVDAIGSSAAPINVNLASPTLTAFDATGFAPSEGTSGSQLTVTVDPVKAAATSELLLIHHLNTTDVRAEVLPVYLQPTVTSVSPSTGRVTGGTTVTVTGSHLTGATAVTFGGTAGTSVTVIDDSHVTAVTPAHAAGAVDVAVTTPGGTATATGAFTYVTAAPGAPTGVGASAGDTKATVWWTAPTDPGTSPITSYTVTGAPGGTCTATAPSTTCDVTGLTNGTSYTFTVTATSAHGTGPASAASPAVVPTGGAVLQKPGRPGAPVATAGIGKATVRVVAPTTGGPPASYVVTASPGGRTCTVTVPATKCTITRLAAGTWYRFTSVAVNAAGSSVASPPSNRVMPMRKHLPVKPFGLPSSVRNAGWTRLMRLPVVMNSGRNATVLVSMHPRLTGRSVGTRGDTGLYRVVTDRSGWVWLWLPGTVPSTVTVTVRAAALPGYTSYLATKTYQTRAVA